MQPRNAPPRRAGNLLVLAACLLLAGCQPIQPLPPEAGATVPVVPTNTITLSADAAGAPESVPTGPVELTLANDSEMDRFVLLARLLEGATADQVMGLLAAGDDMGALALVSLHGGTMAPAGGSSTTTFDLKPGEYLVLAEADQAGEEEAPPPLTTTFVAEGESTMDAPAAAVRAELADFAFVLPDAISAGPQLWEIVNTGQQWHEMGILVLDEGVTVEDLMGMMSAEEPSGPPPWQEIFFYPPIGAGERAWTEIDLPPGEYTVICFLPDVAGDYAPHFAHGMVRTLVVE